MDAMSASIQPAQRSFHILPRSRWGNFAVGALALLGATVGFLGGLRAGPDGKSSLPAACLSAATLGLVSCGGTYVGIKIMESVAGDMARQVLAESTVASQSVS